MFAFQRMKEAGAFITTSECILLGLCNDASHPKFKDIQKIIWDSAPDTGLLSNKIEGETPVWWKDVIKIQEILYEYMNCKSGNFHV